MKEIEILVRIDEKDRKKAMDKLNKIATFQKEKKVVDTYFFDPLRESLKPDKDWAIYECFRLRDSNGKIYVTYKVDNFDEQGKWLYSNESETMVESKEAMQQIITNLGLQELVVVDMTKYYFETTDYTIALECVKNLGAFLEVESKRENTPESEVLAEKAKIEKFIKSIGVKTSPDLGIGKPELLLKKMNGIKL